MIYQKCFGWKTSTALTGLAGGAVGGLAGNLVARGIAKKKGYSKDDPRRKKLLKRGTLIGAGLGGVSAAGYQMRHRANQTDDLYDQLEAAGLTQKSDRKTGFAEKQKFAYSMNKNLNSGRDKDGNSMIVANDFPNDGHDYSVMNDRHNGMYQLIRSNDKSVDWWDRANKTWKKFE